MKKDYSKQELNIKIPISFFSKLVNEVDDKKFNENKLNLFKRYNEHLFKNTKQNDQTVLENKLKNENKRLLIKKRIIQDNKFCFENNIISIISDLSFNRLMYIYKHNCIYLSEEYMNDYYYFFDENYFNFMKKKFDVNNLAIIENEILSLRLSPKYKKFYNDYLNYFTNIFAVYLRIQILIICLNMIENNIENPIYKDIFNFKNNNLFICCKDRLEHLYNENLKKTILKELYFVQNYKYIMRKIISFNLNNKIVNIYLKDKIDGFDNDLQTDIVKIKMCKKINPLSDEEKFELNLIMNFYKKSYIYFLKINEEGHYFQEKINRNNYDFLALNQELIKNTFINFFTENQIKL